MAAPANSLKIVRIVEQGQISLMRLLVMDDCGTRIGSPVCEIYVAPLTAIEIAGQDGEAQGPPLFCEVVLAVFVSRACCHDVWRLGVVAATQGHDPLGVWAVFRAVQKEKELD